MNIKALKVNKIVRSKDDLFLALEAIKKIPEKSVVAVSSKIVSLCEGRTVEKGKISKDDLVAQEADYFIPKNISGKNATPTIKRGILSVAAGIDEFDGRYVLWPKDPMAAAQNIQKFLRKKYRLSALGVIITDSRSTPLRRGLTGFALGYFGFKPLRSYCGRKDLFGRKMKITQGNTADALAAAAVLVMGEGGERTPLAIISGVSDLDFINARYKPTNKLCRFEIKPQDDFYKPLVYGGFWKRKN